MEESLVLPHSLLYFIAQVGRPGKSAKTELTSPVRAAAKDRGYGQQAAYHRKPLVTPFSNTYNIWERLVVKKRDMAKCNR